MITAVAKVLISVVVFWGAVPQWVAPIGIVDVETVVGSVPFAKSIQVCDRAIDVESELVSALDLPKMAAAATGDSVILPSRPVFVFAMSHTFADILTTPTDTGFNVNYEGSPTPFFYIAAY